MRGHFLRETVAANEQIEQVGDDFGIGLQRAVVTELLDVATVGVIAGNLAIVHDRPVQKSERVSTAPPARRIGGKTPVCSPQPGLVFVDTVVLADFFRVAHALERAHVLARACNERSINVGINVEHALHDVFLLVKFAQFKLYDATGAG